MPLSRSLQSACASHATQEDGSPSRRSPARLRSRCRRSARARTAGRRFPVEGLEHEADLLELLRRARGGHLARLAEQQRSACRRAWRLTVPGRRRRRRWCTPRRSRRARPQPRCGGPPARRSPRPPEQLVARHLAAASPERATGVGVRPRRRAQLPPQPPAQEHAPRPARGSDLLHGDDAVLKLALRLVAVLDHPLKIDGQRLRRVVLGARLPAQRTITAPFAAVVRRRARYPSCGGKTRMHCRPVTGWTSGQTGGPAVDDRAAVDDDELAEHHGHVRLGELASRVGVQVPRQVIDRTAELARSPAALAQRALAGATVGVVMS